MNVRQLLLPLPPSLISCLPPTSQAISKTSAQVLHCLKAVAVLPKGPSGTGLLDKWCLRILRIADEVADHLGLHLQLMLGFLREFEAQLGVKIICSQETEPMGTAGPLALARKILDDGSGDPFFVLNSDVISEYPLKAMLEFHKAHNAEATIMVTKVRTSFAAAKATSYRCNFF